MAGVVCPGVPEELSDNCSRPISMFQSTPARGGRLPSSPLAFLILRVSIHARTRRATRNPLTRKLVLSMFQSTPARGGRPAVRGSPAFLHKVSIHARTRRATRAGSVRVQGNSFNPRPHAAGDQHWRQIFSAATACFNPRPHAAGDKGRPRWRWPRMFQSTPARGGRRTV